MPTYLIVILYNITNVKDSKQTAKHFWSGF